MKGEINLILAKLALHANDLKHPDSCGKRDLLYTEAFCIEDGQLSSSFRDFIDQVFTNEYRDIITAYFEKLVEIYNNRK